MEVSIQFNGRMDDQGIFSFPSGNKFVGKYKDGEHLNEALYDKFGKFIGKYVNGELH